MDHFHPLSAIGYIAVLFFCAMTWANPLWLFLLLMVTVLPLCNRGTDKRWKPIFLMACSVAFLCALLNVLFSQQGETLLWLSPPLPLIGRLRFTLEALVFGFTTGLRIVVVITLFFLYGTMVDRHDVMNLFSRIAPRSAITMTLAVLLLPRLRRDFRRIREAMALRGVSYDSGGIITRVAAVQPLFDALLFSTLEGAWDTAIALRCRGYGSGKRSAYHRTQWRLRDLLLLTSAAAAAVTATTCRGGNPGAYSFYPRLEPVVRAGDMAPLIVIFGAFSALVILQWGMNQWPSFRCKI